MEHHTVDTIEVTNSLQYSAAKEEQHERQAQYSGFDQDWDKLNKGSFGVLNMFTKVGGFISSLPGYKQLNEFMDSKVEQTEGTPENFHKKGREQDAAIEVYEEAHPDDVITYLEPRADTLEA